MRGHLYHTNEIMVLLGDNWFARRTAKQAIEIAGRRNKCKRLTSHHFMSSGVVSLLQMCVKCWRKREK